MKEFSCLPLLLFAPHRRFSLGVATAESLAGFRLCPPAGRAEQSTACVCLVREHPRSLQGRRRATPALAFSTLNDETFPQTPIQAARSGFSPSPSSLCLQHQRGAALPVHGILGAGITLGVGSPLGWDPWAGITLGVGSLGWDPRGSHFAALGTPSRARKGLGSSRAWQRHPEMPTRSFSCRRLPVSWDACTEN